MHFGLVAAGSLLIDYVLTVSVSIAAGVDALTSAFPALVPYNVIFGLAMILIIVVVNLRGVRESGSIFAAPTYLFVGSFLLMIVVGIIHAAMNGGLLHNLPPQPSNFPATEHLSLFLILTAFASGCAAMTGTEAISNGVPIFKPRQEKNAAATLVMMATLLGIMYAGTTFLTWRYGISPQQNSNPTVDSQLASLFFTGWFGWFFYVIQFATALILVLAANTSFADFPRLSSILARDEYLPHIFSRQGDRLVFNTGIIVLGILSAVLLVIFSGNTEALINLYALGVFTAFTLSQSGMVRRWLRTREPHWRRGLAINAFGALATGIVTLIIAVSKFDRGAWIVVILIPLL
ncbi:MAG TPA: APC family permease, partial [Ktedonobacterales bacterium]|nr:APC family permease [Ktedonobacterales bacterium]